MLQDVPPPRVLDARGHVVRDDVQEQPHAARLEVGRQPVERLPAAERVAQPQRVGDVVAVRRAGAGLEHRREVHVADPERLQVRQQRPDVVEAELGPELQPVRRERRPHADRSSENRSSCSEFDTRLVARRRTTRGRPSDDAVFIRSCQAPGSSISGSVKTRVLGPPFRSSSTVSP